MLDTLIINGVYPDYDKGKMTQGNVGIRGGKIEYLGDAEPVAGQIIEAKGRVVSPGFIDIHMHEEDFVQEGAYYCVAERMLRMGVTTAVGGNCGLQHQPIRVFRETIEKLGGSPINYIMLAGYNQCRYALSIGRYESADPAARTRIAEMLRQELDDGAFGISFGIEYDPGISTEEILFGCHISEDPNHLIAAHYRADNDHALEALQEMIDIQSQIPQRFQISHLSSCSATGQMEDSLNLIHQAMDRDPRLGFDTYPYDAFSTHIGSAVFDDGCLEAWNRDYDSILLTSEPYTYQRCTREIFHDARTNYPEMLAVAFVMNEDEIRQAVADPYGIIASDAIINQGEGHPRAAGTFPRVLGKYVREEQALTLYDALRKMTLAPAERLGLTNKGYIGLGCDADLTILDPDTILDQATYTEGSKAPVGIDYVIIDGKIAMKDGAILDGRCGRFIPYR